MPVEARAILDTNWSFDNLGRLGNLFRHRITHISDGGAIEYIHDDPVMSGAIQVITRVSVENETSDYNQLRIGVLHAELFHPHEEEKNPNAGQLYWMSEEIYLGEREKLRIALSGTSASDVITVYIEGFEARIMR